MRMKPYGKEAPIYNLLTSGKGTVLNEDETGILVKDQTSGVHFLDQPNVKVAEKWLEPVLENKALLCIIGEEPAMAILKKHRLHHGKFCVQCVHSGLEEEDSPHIRKAVFADLAWMKDCPVISPEELAQCVHDREVFVFELEGKPAGFAGIHQDESMGFLYVLPQYRRQGIGKRLEKAVVAHQTGKGMVPYCHVFSDNTASLKLQHECGLTFGEDLVLWCWNDGRQKGVGK